MMRETIGLVGPTGICPSWARPALAVVLPILFAILRLTNVGQISVTLCPFRGLTGVPCPGCGMTRAVSEVVRGELIASLHHHPLGLVIASLAVASWFWTLISLCRERLGGRAPAGEESERWIYRPRWLAAAYALLITAWLWNLWQWVNSGYAVSSLRASLLGRMLGVAG